MQAATSAPSSETVQASLHVSKIPSSNPPQRCEVECAACECCGLTEECTPAYIEGVREQFYGRWVCGLCGEAVKDELCRSDRVLGMEEALEAHMTFCMQLRANPAVRLIASMKQLLRKTLDTSSSPGGSLRSSPTKRRLIKKDVGFSTLAGSRAEG